MTPQYERPTAMLLAFVLALGAFPLFINTAEAASHNADQTDRNDNADATPRPSNIKSGSDFKTGPVTDDDKLLKPVAKDAKHPTDTNSSKLSPNPAPAGNQDDPSNNGASKNNTSKDDASNNGASNNGASKNGAAQKKGSQNDGSQNNSSQNNAPPNSDATGKPANFKSGSDFKTGPVTDDDKLLKPVAKDAKNPTDVNSSKLSPNPAGKDADANPIDQKSTSKSRHEKIKPVSDEGQTDDTNQPKKNIDVSVNNKGPISIGAVKLAKDIEMLDLIGELNDLKVSHAYTPGQRVHNIEVISLRQDLDELLLSAFLSTRRVVSELDRQIAGYDAVARVLEEKRDTAIRYNNILNFTSGGALAMTQGSISIGTPMRYQNAGNELGVIAGALTALIGAYALKIQKGAKRSSDRDPNMLAPIFGLVPNEPNKYPPSVWNYLNEKEPGQKKTRREQLIDRWVKLNYIEPLDKPSSKKHLEELSGAIALHKEVTIDLLRDRIPMLEDVRAAVAGINEYLDEILTFVRKP